MRARHVPDSPKGMGIGLGGMGRREGDADLKDRAFKIEVSKVSGSALAAEICTGPRNRLLRRQHCSSLCSQSEGSGPACIKIPIGRVFKIQENQSW